jgi:hypothetical protein
METRTPSIYSLYERDTGELETALDTKRSLPELRDAFAREFGWVPEPQKSLRAPQRFEVDIATSLDKLRCTTAGDAAHRNMRAMAGSQSR